MSPTEMLLPTFSQMLRALSAWLDKATAQEEAAGTDPEALLSRRLAPDMYPMASQVRFACFLALETVYRLRGEAVPHAVEAIRNAGWNGGEQPGTLAGARQCIEETITLLANLDPDALDDSQGRRVSITLPDGLIFDMTGAEYVRDWSLPQFYFHLTAAYAILRSAGIALGKADYVPHMFAYIRPGTLPRP